VIKPEWDRLIYNGNKFGTQNIARMTEGCQSELPEHLDVDANRASRFLVYDSNGTFIGIYEYYLDKKEFVPYKMFL
jgi:hypothetical protein